VVNASISGETTDGGLRRLTDLLERHQPDIVMIELGGNDGLRGFPPGVIRQNLSKMIEQSRAINARVLLVGMQIPLTTASATRTLSRRFFRNWRNAMRLSWCPFFW